MKYIIIVSLLIGSLMHSQMNAWKWKKTEYRKSEIVRFEDENASHKNGIVRIKASYENTVKIHAEELKETALVKKSVGYVEPSKRYFIDFSTKFNDGLFANGKHTFTIEVSEFGYTQFRRDQKIAKLSHRDSTIDSEGNTTYHTDYNTITVLNMRSL